jgi:hypothetical protein
MKHVNLALCVLASALVLAASADARVQSPALGSLYTNPNTANSCVDTTNGAIHNSCADNTGKTFTWNIPLPMDTTGAKTPTIYFSDFCFSSPVDTSYCKGHRVNSAGTVVASTTAVNLNDCINLSPQSMPSLTLGANETYILTCQLGGTLGVQQVQYTP